MIERNPEEQTRLRRMGGARFVLLTCVLLVLTLGFVANNLGLIPSGSTAPEVQEDAWPTDEDVLDSLDGLTIALPDAEEGARGPVETPLRLDRGRIGALHVKREDSFFTSARFDVETGRGRYTIEGSFNHQ